MLAALAVGGGVLLLRDSEDPRRAAAEQYVRDVNAVQAGAAIELDKISRTYEGIRLDPVALRQQQGELEQAERTVRRLQARVRAIVPPPEARRVHAELLELLGMQAGLATEMTQLARYVPLWAEQAEGLEAATARLRDELRTAKTTDAQRAAFARYTAGVGAAAEALSALVAPAVLEPPRRQEVARLRRIHDLASRVRDAIPAGRAAAVGSLLESLGDVSATPNTNRTQRAAIAAYNRRIERLTTQRATVERALVRLGQDLG